MKHLTYILYGLLLIARSSFAQYHDEYDMTQFVQFIADQTNPDYFDSHDHQEWQYYLSKSHPDVATIEGYFDLAAEEYSVPTDLLKAIGKLESNWTQIGPSIDRGWGIMHLVSNANINTLGEASKIAGIAEKELKDNAQSNIRGAAALLAHYAGKDVVGEYDLTLWFDAAMQFSALATEELRHSQALNYFQLIKKGATSRTIWNESIQLKAYPSLQLPNKGTSSIKKSISTDYGPAISFLTPCNFGQGRNHPIDTWVNHWIGVGTYAGAISWFHTCRPAGPSSAHFVIRSSDGEITQVVAVSNTAYHAGASGFLYNNSRSIGVEHEATATNPSLWNSVPMINASAEMACYFADLYNIPSVRGLPGIREHNEMPGTNTECAGSIPWTAWMNSFSNCQNGATALDCSNIVSIECGIVYKGSPSSEPSLVDAYSCNNWTETGPERMHKIISPGYGTLTATISNFTGDLDVYILGSCDPTDCLGAVSSSSASFANAIAGQAYYIVVDADDGSGSSYDLLVNCTSGGSGPGLDCSQVIPLQCGVIFSGPSSNANSNVLEYACNNWTETGPERVHSITPNANGILTASISNYSGDLDVYILNSCDPQDCIGTVSSDSAILDNAVAGQTYYIVVDADDGTGSSYDLLVDCPQVGLNCFNAIELTCGIAYNASPSLNSSFVNSYACNNWTETGPERVHLIVPQEGGTLKATLTNFTGDLDVYILGSCDPTDCSATVSSSSAKLNNVVAGQAYYIVVDADDGSASGYTLNISCPESDCISTKHISGTYSQDEVFQAQDLLTTDAELRANVNFELKAGISVELMEGFSVESGTVVNIKIERCQ